MRVAALIMTLICAVVISDGPVLVLSDPDHKKTITKFTCDGCNSVMSFGIWNLWKIVDMLPDGGNERRQQTNS
jgi:hypothetical protein